MADSLHHFTSLLMSSIFKLFPFPSFVQNIFSFPFLFTVSSSPNTLTHLFRPNISLWCRQKARVFLAVRGRKLPPTILQPKSCAKMLPFSNWSTPRSMKGVTTPIVSGRSPYWLVVQCSHPFSGGTWWLPASNTGLRVAFYLLPRHRGVLGPFGFFDPRSWYMPRYFTPHAHSLWVRIRHFVGLEGVGRWRVGRYGFHGY